MSGMVDRSGVTEPPAGSAPADPNQKGQGAPGRIQELLGQKKVMQEHIASQAAALEQMKSDVAYLKGRDSATQPVQDDGGYVNSWEQMNDGQLSEAFQVASEAGNTQGAWQASEELARRKAEQAASRTEQNLRQEYADRNDRQTKATGVYARIQQDFGFDVTKPDASSPLFLAAKQFVSGYTQEQLDDQPEIIYSAFAAADNQQNPGRNQELLELRGQVAQFKEQSSQPSRGPNFVKQGTAPPPESSEFLKQGNVKSAIRNLTTVRSFDE